MMRAVVIEGPGRVGVARVPVPEPRAGEVLIRMEGSGICGSEMPVFEGRGSVDYPLDPGAPGHEGWGVVEAVGSGVTGVHIGQRVAAISQRAHADLDVAPADALVPIPEEVGDDPFPGEPLGCAANVFDRAAIEPGHHVAIVGVGFIGAVVVALANKAGARAVAISRRPYSLDVARRMGAEETISLGDDVVGAAEKLTDGRLFDRVIECTGRQDPLTLAAELTRVRGRLVIAGYHQDGLRTVNMQLWNWRGIDVINAHERETSAYVRGVRMAADAIRQGRLDPSPLYTHAFPRGEAEKAYRTAAERPDGFMKALITS
jgi:2-desacetyl-2-hydroxyethyl bacteriochlorophyllide A dehydrogenase